MVLGVDMDDTLIRTKSGAKFARDASDWVFWHEKVATVLREYTSNGYRVVVFTNQAGISKGHTS
jgi:bifunctional polynucleotide phosphatase/kinase